jgi:multidrug efflux pump subunit AcrA (membrane-fusion protein)
MNATAAPRTAKKKRARWMLIALVAVVVIALAVTIPVVMGGPTGAATPVPTTTVSTGELVVSVSADGQTEAAEVHDVYPGVSGTVKNVEVEVGDIVEAGATLFVVDDADLQASVRQANAQLSQANQQVAQANQQVAQANQQLLQAELQQSRAEDNLDTLESQTGTMTATPARIDAAQDEVDVAKAGVRSASAGLSSAKASLSSAEIARSNAEKNLAEARANLDDVVVVAPASGVVTSVNVAEGGSVSTGGGTSTASSGAGSSGAAAMSGAATSAGSTGSSAPVAISQVSSLTVVVAVNEVDIADIASGQDALVTFDAVSDTEIAGTVSWVSPNATTTGNVRTYDVKLELDEQNDGLRPGMTATASIVTTTIADALLIPKTAVRVDGTAKFVTVVRPDGGQEKRTITTGRSDDVNVQVLSGLKEDEAVTTSFTTPEEESGGGFMPPSPPAGMGGN